MILISEVVFMAKMVIYHGSASVIDRPVFGEGKVHNDYGYGFYCTRSLDLAKEWAVDRDRDGYVNKYVLQTNGLKILNLLSGEYSILNWMALLVQNRVFNLKYDIAKAGKEYLIENYLLPVSEYDVIIGYRGDDAYFGYAELFLNNSISAKKLSETLKHGNLGEQVVLISEKAFSQITFEGAEKAKSEIYNPLRQGRNEKARLEYITRPRDPLSREIV